MIEKTLAKLISFKTVSQDQEENQRALDWIKSQIEGLPLYVKELKSRGFFSLVITTQKTKKPILWLVAHIDVVPATKEIFVPRIKNKKLYGRGAFDMKFAIACYLELLKVLGTGLSNYDFGVIITTDEEKGGFSGVKFLLEKGFSSEACFLPDGGQAWNFEKAAKGAYHLSIESKGKSAHGSRPWLGENALENLMDFLFALKKHFPTEPCSIKNHYHPTINVGRIEGGEVANKVPAFAQALIDIRFPLSTNQAKLKKVLWSTKSKFKNIRLKELVFAPAYENSFSSPYLKIFYKIARNKFNIRSKGIISHGTSDARFFAVKKIPLIVTRPRGGGHHSENEWIDLEDLDKFYLVLKEFVEKTTKIS